MVKMTEVQRRVEFMDMCCRHDLFTCGSNEQYNEVMRYYATLRFFCGEIFENKTFEGKMQDLEPVVYMTWICSDTDKFTVNDVREAILELL